MLRPRPPADLIGLEGAVQGDTFVPAPDVLAWAKATFIEEGAPLLNHEHAHLSTANIGVLWTNAPNSRHGRDILGQAEFKPPGGTMGKWARARAAAQLAGWFGPEPLDFLITLSAPYAAICSDAAFCSLVEHELCHCGQEKDEFGQPKFSRTTGEPVYAIRGHDIEQFTSVVARYGADAAGVRELIAAAAMAPICDDAMIAGCCGTCGD